MHTLTFSSSGASKVLPSANSRTEVELNWHELILLIAPTIAVIANGIFSQIMRSRYKSEFHLTLNSRLTELLNAARLQAFAEGQIKGAADQRQIK